MELAIAAAALLFAAFQTWTLRQTQKDLNEIATEALLASRAQSAEDLSTASILAHQAALERAAPAPKAAARRPVIEDPTPLRDKTKFTGPDGKVLQVLRPLG